MSESIRAAGLLGEERVTLEPFKTATLDYAIDDTCILGGKRVSAFSLMRIEEFHTVGFLKNRR